MKQAQNNKTLKDKAGPSRPSRRMVRAARAMVADGCVSTADALRKAGYSEAVARNPSKVTSSKTFRELLSELVPEEDRAETHGLLLRAGSLVHEDFNAGRDAGGFTEKEARGAIEMIPGAVFVRSRKLRLTGGTSVIRVYYIKPDNQARAKALQALYRLSEHDPVEKDRQAPFSLSALRRLSESRVSRL